MEDKSDKNLQLQVCPYFMVLIYDLCQIPIKDPGTIIFS